MRKLQEEHREWLERTFPDQPSWLPAAGLVEEAGELLKVVVKMDRMKRYGPESRYANRDLRAELIDAIGDCAIYCCSLCNAKGWDFAAVVDRAVGHNTGQMRRELALLLVQCALNVEYNAHSTRLVAYISLLKTLCAIEFLDFEDVVRSTWILVRERKR